MMAQTIEVKRQAVLPLSVDWERRGNEGDYIGYIRIHSFQESTLQEGKDALTQLQQQMGLRGVILDLRGNPGGLFKSALDVAELFLPDSVIVHTHGPETPGHPENDLNRVYRSHNMSPYGMPLVALVDGETASAAEILAGALKDNGRAKVVGQTTYGKGSIQCVIPLERAPGGLRLTVARFSTPSRVPFSGRGLLPHVTVNESDPDVALRTAEQVLRGAMIID